MVLAQQLVRHGACAGSRADSPCLQQLAVVYVTRRYLWRTGCSAQITARHGGAAALQKMPAERAEHSPRTLPSPGWHRCPRPPAVSPQLRARVPSAFAQRRTAADAITKRQRAPHQPQGSACPPPRPCHVRCVRSRTHSARARGRAGGPGWHALERCVRGRRRHVRRADLLAGAVVLSCRAARADTGEGSRTAWRASMGSMAMATESCDGAARGAALSEARNRHRRSAPTVDRSSSSYNASHCRVHALIICCARARERAGRRIRAAPRAERPDWRRPGTWSCISTMARRFSARAALPLFSNDVLYDIGASGTPRRPSNALSCGAAE
jgi:hypothetical protein